MPSEDSDQTANAQADLNLGWVHMSKDMFSDIETHIHERGKCPKILNTKVSDKMAYTNSADPDQTAPDGAI